MHLKLTDVDLKKAEKVQSAVVVMDFFPVIMVYGFCD